MENKLGEIVQTVPIEFYSDVSVRMLEQLNRTLELLNQHGGWAEEEKRLRAKVCSAISLLCDPMVYVED